MNADEVASFLHAHPDFFIDHAELLAEMNFSNTHGASAVSLVERQVGLLRDKAKLLEGKLGELIGFGEENDIIAEKVHRLAVDLQGANDMSRAVGALYTHLTGAFTVPCVAVRLWGIAAGDAETAEEFQPVSDAIKLVVNSLQHPYCGPVEGQEAALWFGERSTPIRSLTQIPLREQGFGGACFGLLVLASEDPYRFYSDMGTLYLSRIGDLAAAALLRVVG
ncbi:conserved protein of unknown function [Georgfuchsia toluolica]|uniref:DUF484 family protein n=1 Tax=Georgfuchsia toluolica TaxID=424218 RepID=A0A916J4H1_9PROT|nr:DUF484 family protein [Georgfuchsia toluolica]CAG4884494.1 conserved protein of unknown function [Georgfuchsia toluolica]